VVQPFPPALERGLLNHVAGEIVNSAQTQEIRA